MRLLGSIVLFLLCLPGPTAAEDTLADYVKLREHLRQDVKKIAQGCQKAMRVKHPKAAGRVELYLLIDPKGAVTVERYGTHGFLNAEPLPQGAYACLSDGVGGLRLPPPAGHALKLCVPVTLHPEGFRGMWRSRPKPGCERSFEVVPPKPDLLELFREGMAEVVFAKEQEVEACLRSAKKATLILRWVIAGNGRVAMVDLSKDLPVKLRECVRKAVIRWKFPQPPDNKAFVVDHLFRVTP